jgi:hypothetical protein
LYDLPVHLLGLLDDLLAVAVRSSAFLLCLLGGGGLVFLNLVVLVGLLDAHLAVDTRHTQTEIGIIKHVDGQLDRFRAEVDYNQSE